MNLDSEAWRYVLAALIALVAFQAALWVVNRVAKPPVPISAFSLDQTISDLKAELLKLEAEPGLPLGLKLSEITIELQVKQADTKTATGELGLPVFKAADLKAGTGWQWEEGSKVTITLVPPVDHGLLSTPAKPVLKFADLLLAVRKSLQAGMESEPRLDAKSIEAELAFVLVTEASSGADVKVQLLSLGVGGSRKSTAGNTVTLTYENPAYADKRTAKPTPP